MTENNYNELQEPSKWQKKFESGYKVVAKGFVGAAIVLGAALSPADAEARSSFTDLLDKGYDVGRIVEDIGELTGSEKAQDRGQEIQDRNSDRKRTVNSVKDLGNSIKRLFGR